MSVTLTYIVIEPSVVGDSRGFEIVHSWNGVEYQSHEEAKQAGLESRGSDDFNICSLRGSKLVGYFWMDEPMDDPEGMAAIAKEHGFKLTMTKAQP